MTATSQSPAASAMVAESVWATKDEPPKFVLSTKRGWMPRYSDKDTAGMACTAEPAKTPSTSGSPSPQSASAASTAPAMISIAVKPGAAPSHRGGIDRAAARGLDPFERAGAGAGRQPAHVEEIGAALIIPLQH